MLLNARHDYKLIEEFVGYEFDFYQILFIIYFINFLSFQSRYFFFYLNQYFEIP